MSEKLKIFLILFVSLFAGFAQNLLRGNGNFNSAVAGEIFGYSIGIILFAFVFQLFCYLIYYIFKRQKLNSRTPALIFTIILSLLLLMKLN